LDRSLDDRAYWAYHHRYDMDRRVTRRCWRTTNNSNRASQALEAQQTPRDPAYVPPSLGQEQRDLMYSDNSITTRRQRWRMCRPKTSVT